MGFWSKKLKIDALPAWKSEGPLRTFNDLPAVRQAIALYTKTPAQNIGTTDGQFIEVPDTVIDRAIKWQKTFLWVFNLKWVSNSFDCDKYAKLFTLIVEMMCGIARIKRQPLIGRLCVINKHAFAHIPDTEGGHALVIAKTPSGVRVIEPQNGINCYWADYPNREHVFKILLGG